MVVAEKRQSRIVRINPIDLSSPPKPLEQLPVQQTDAEVDALVKEFIDAMKTGEVKEIERNYPEIPSHTCQVTATLCTVWADVASFNRKTQRHWRGGVDKLTGESYQRCEACYQVRVRRFTEQILCETERGYTLSILDAPEAKKKVNALRQRAKRGNDVIYLSLPHATGNGSFIVNNQSEGEELPEDCHELFTVIYRIADTPKGKNVGSSRGFGGNYAGNKGNAKRTKERKNAEQAGESSGVVQLYTKQKTSQVVKKLEKQGFAMSKTTSGAVVYAFAPVVLRYLDTQGGWCVLGTKTPLQSENVPHLVDSNLSFYNLPNTVHSENEPEVTPEPTASITEVETTHTICVPAEPRQQTTAQSVCGKEASPEDSQESDRILALDIAFGGTRYARAS